MRITLNVAKVVWGISMTVFTIWLSCELFAPLLIHLFSSDLSWFAFLLAFLTSLFFIIAVWGFLGYGISIIATATGFALGLIVEMLVWCYRKIRL
ncbi:hypothetical protein B0187_06015 [Haemophilus paracuniculus]|uniref:Uncharacterized protein n=1 Tax=Haemophilus paracuniculus TaxID=734 RepID=A0A1T0ATG9_9PAST|nr:hypothetical protein [Haemophilus paracuniculus]OOR99310.1 hypothetical protein B0187_06015 [Haemophilus paracuniculus]